MSMIVGRPAPAAIATWSKPYAHASSIGSVPPKRTPPYIRSAGAGAQRQVEQREEVLVPADGDAVLGDAAEPLEHALVERAVDLAPVADRLAAASVSVPARSSGSGSIFRPSMPTTPKPSFTR